MTRSIFLFLLAYLAVGNAYYLVGHAYAEPPDRGTEDYAILAPHAEWLHQQTGPTGISCCSIADCRTVEWRQAAGQIEVMLPASKFPEAPNAWIAVPDDVIHRNQNPTGRAVACWSAAHRLDAGFYCFWLPSLT